MKTGTLFLYCLVLSQFRNLLVDETSSIMHGIILTIFGLLIVVQVQSACTRRQASDDNIQFVDQNDDMESIREKIRTEMDQYRKLKEISLKSKNVKTSTVLTTTSTTTEASSTVRHVHLIGHEEEELEESPADVPEESERGEEMTTMGVVNLNIFDVPVVCKSGFVLVGTRCRKLA